MTKKRFKITQNGDLFTVRDTVENESMGVFEFKENEFPVYACFHRIIDLMNELDEKYIDEFSLRETLQLELQRVEEENKKLKHTITETEKMVQSTYDELTKLRCIKKNLARIKAQWDWIMEAIQYD